MIRVLIWNEYYHELNSEKAIACYPDGIHRTIGAFLGEDSELEISYATLQDENCGITRERLANTDVLIWWGHIKHNDVPDSVARLVQEAVLGGMGVIFLHSSHHSKPFRFLMGCDCHLTWRLSYDAERIWVVEPWHPIVQGIDRYFELESEETYAEPFEIPTPDLLLMIGSFSGGEVFRSGALYRRGAGNVFYFQPGHETCRSFYHPAVQTVIRNAVHYLKPSSRCKIQSTHVRTLSHPDGYVIS